MNETVVADTGPLLHLAEIGQENQLSIFKLVIIPEQIRTELKQRGIFEPLAEVLSERLLVQSVDQVELDVQRTALSSFKIHQADLSVAALAVRLIPDVVLTDDLELRRGLELQGYSVTGSVGVLVRAFKTGRLTKLELQTCFEQLFDDSTLYLSKGFYNYIHKLLNSSILR